MANASSLDVVINLAKRGGFVYQSGEIYGGSRSAWDYDPLGVVLKENIERRWWQTMVDGREDVVGLDSAVILPRRIWEASGPARCSAAARSSRCKRYWAGHPGDRTEPQNFSGLLKTILGPVDNEERLHYLRQWTGQGIFVNFANVLGSARMKPPFGIDQIGKSFRNEITPGNFLFRTREFEQMEMEFFGEPGMDEQWHQY